MTLPDGLYDQLLTERLLSGLDLERADLAAFNGDRHELLLDALARQLASALEDAADDEAGPALRQVELVNALLVLLRQRQHQTQEAIQPESTSVDLIASPPRPRSRCQRQSLSNASSRIKSPSRRPFLHCVQRGRKPSDWRRQCAMLRSTIGYASALSRQMCPLNGRGPARCTRAISRMQEGTETNAQTGHPR